MGYWALKIKDGSFLGTERFAVDLFLRDVLGRSMTCRLELTAVPSMAMSFTPGRATFPFAGLITSLSARGERIALSLSVRNRRYWKLRPKR